MHYQLKAKNWNISLNTLQEDSELITKKRLKGYNPSMKDVEIVELARLERCGLLK